MAASVACVVCEMLTKMKKSRQRNARKIGVGPPVPDSVLPAPPHISRAFTTAQHVKQPRTSSSPQQTSAHLPVLHSSPQHLKHSPSTKQLLCPRQRIGALLVPAPNFLKSPPNRDARAESRTQVQIADLRHLLGEELVAACPDPGLVVGVCFVADGGANLEERGRFHGFG